MKEAIDQGRLFLLSKFDKEQLQQCLDQQRKPVFFYNIKYKVFISRIFIVYYLRLTMINDIRNEINDFKTL